MAMFSGIMDVSNTTVNNHKFCDKTQSTAYDAIKTSQCVVY